MVRGVPPALDLDAERVLQELLVRLADSRLIRSSHDCSDGGLAIAAVERSVHALSEGAAADADLYTNAAVRVMASYKRRLADSAMPGSVEAERLRQADGAEITLRLAALQAEREAIFRLAREYQISDELSRRLVRQIDLMEARYR